MSKKKLVLIFILAIWLLAFLSSLIYVKVSTNNSPKLISRLVVKEEENTLISKDDDIKILQLADTQIFNYLDTALAINTIKKVVVESNPDLIVLTGDNVASLSTKGPLKLLIKFMDSFQIPWAVVYGNHEYLSFTSIETQSELYQSSEYCIFKKGNIEESDGNYYYNIVKDNKIIYSLIFMNSEKKGFRKEHVEWYEKTINEITDKNNGVIVPSLTFFHIPPQELNDAYNAYINDNSLGEGIKKEIINTQETNSDFYNKAKELGSAKAFIYGHDHLNSLSINYDGILFSYGVKTGKTSHFDFKLQGGVLYSINANKELSVERIFLSNIR